MLNRAQWARLDPDNVAPWLELGAEAHERGEAEAEADAMGHAALARRSDGYEELLPQLVERTLAGSAPSLRHALALTAARTAQAVWAASRSNHAYEYCAAGMAADTVAVNVRTCPGLAGLADDVMVVAVVSALTVTSTADDENLLLRRRGSDDFVRGQG